jgi:hypothetical protein
VRIGRGGDIGARNWDILAPDDRDVRASRGHLDSSYSPGQGGDNGITDAPPTTA